MRTVLALLLVLFSLTGCDDAAPSCSSSSECEASESCLGGRCVSPDAEPGDAGTEADAGPLPDGSTPDSSVPMDAGDPCAAIAAHADWSLCGGTEGLCEGVFEDSAGCAAFCAEAGLSCTAGYEDREGMCMPNTDLPELGCGPTGHISDYCVCGECVPSCDGRACGSDGCGGSCGSCGSGESCVAGTCSTSTGELKAFPSAFGAGAYVTGGRGGVVVHVTSLADSGPGTLREALALDMPRTIVFDVAGVIELESILGDIADDVTVAGQTAPAGGITVDGQRLYLSSVDNVIWRYMRFRGGVDGDNDSLTVVSDITNQIFDHCSFSFDNDETASWYANDAGDRVANVTIQRCFFGEGSKGSIVGGSAGVDVGEVSVLRNLYYNQTHRYPNIANNGGDIEVINNVSWTTAHRLIRGDGDGNLNHLGNYNDYGDRGISDTRLNMYTYISSALPAIFTSGNRIVARNTGSPLTGDVAGMNADNTLMWRVFQDAEGLDRGTPLPAACFVGTAHPLLGAPTEVLTAEEALVEVSNDVGANARILADGAVVDNTDVLDAEWLANVRSGTYVSRVNRSEYNVPAIVGGAPYLDADRDGMADEWELARGLDPTDGTDHDDDDDGDGYTNLEEFLNVVDER